MRLRRWMAMFMLIGLSLAFASRFQAPKLTALPVAPEPVAAPAIPGTTLPAATTTSTSTSTTTTTIALLALPAPEETVDGEIFEGKRIYTNWGWVKVDIVVVDGLMIDAEMVMTPKATKRSIALTAEYEPVLREQALTTQSPDVDMITGATTISDGYKRSLVGAMQAAGLWAPPPR